MQLSQSDSGDLSLRLLAWLVRQVGARTLVGVALLGLVVSSVVVGVSQITHRLDFGLLNTAALAGMLLAWRLARARPGRYAGLRAAAWSGLAGLVWSSLSAGRLWGLIGRVIWQGLGLLVQAQSWRYGEPLPDPHSFLALLSSLGLRVRVLIQQETVWLTGLLDGAPPFDPAAASLVWGLVLWIVSAWAGWWLRHRRQPLWALLPAAGLLGIGLAFSRTSPLYLFPVLTGWLALMAWSSYERRQRAWEQHRVDIAEGLNLDLSLWGLATVMGISSLAYVLATFSPAQTAQALQRMFQPEVQAAQRMGESLGLEQRPTPTPLPPPPGVLPRKHLIGAGPELSQQVVMVVAVSEPPAAGAPLSQAPAAGGRSAYYWRAVTYDLYTGVGWMTSPTDSWSYQPGEAVTATLANPARPITLTVQMPAAVYAIDAPQRAAVYFDGELVNLNKEYGVDWRPAGAGEADLFRAWLPDASQAGSYQVQARRLVAGEQELRQATQPLPAWIAERYLALPENLSPRVRALGQALAGTADDPYARAKAIEASLRRYPYTLDLPPPPAGRELSEYFLFELRRGFCDYYATTMVVLARAAGLPARLAVGYAQGSYNPTQQAFIVTEADAHSWPEIYFSGIGWVVFEPTGGRPALERPAQAPPEPLPLEPAAPPGATHGRPTSSFWTALQAGLRAGLILLAWAAGLLALGWLVQQQVQAWRLRQMAPGQALAALYQRLRRIGLRLGLVEPPGQTPYELAGLLGKRLDGLVTGRRRLHTRLRSWLAPAPGEARRLVELYAQAAYSPHPPEPSSLANALAAWRSLERRLWLARLYRYILRL